MGHNSAVLNNPTMGNTTYHNSAVQSNPTMGNTTYQTSAVQNQTNKENLPQSSVTTNNPNQGQQFHHTRNNQETSHIQAHMSQQHNTHPYFMPMTSAGHMAHSYPNASTSMYPMGMNPMMTPMVCQPNPYQYQTPWMSNTIQGIPSSAGPTPIQYTYPPHQMSMPAGHVPSSTVSFNMRPYEIANVLQPCLLYTSPSPRD